MEKEAGTGSQKNEESASSHARKPRDKLVVHKKGDVAPRHESSPSSPPLSPAPLHDRPISFETERPLAEEKSTIAEEKITELPGAAGRLPTFFQNRDLWSSEEDEMLKQYAVDHNKNWKKISGLITGRSHHDCMMRYHTKTAPIGGIGDQMDLEKIHLELAEMKMEIKTSVEKLKDEIELVRVETLSALTAINETTSQILSQLK